MTPLRGRLLPILALLIGAPVCAEYLQAYLPVTGDGLMMLAGLLVLGPLYGGSALLIREVSLRADLGWGGRALLAAAFGVTMTTFVDLSLWTRHRPDVAYWDDLQLGTFIAPAGLAVGPLMSWVSGHVIFSVLIPLALTDALSPRHRDRPLLGRPGLVVACLGVGIAAVLIHGDARTADNVPDLWQAVGSAALIIGLAGTAFRCGRPSMSRRAAGEPWRPAVLAAWGFVGAFAIDMTGFGWISLAVCVCLLAIAVLWIRRAGRSPGWGTPHVTALAAGALLARCTIGFMAPLPPGTSPAAKTIQSVVIIIAAGLVCLLAWRRAREHNAGRAQEVGRP